MAYTNEYRKILGQIDTDDAASGVAYQVPASTEAIVSSLVFCNRGAAAVLSAYIVSSGDGNGETQQFIYWDLAIPADDTFVATIGITLSAGDSLRTAAASTAAGSSVSVNVFGVEIS